VRSRYERRQRMRDYEIYLYNTTMYLSADHVEITPKDGYITFVKNDQIIAMFVLANIYGWREVG
jgi:hypothetical protein